MAASGRNRAIAAPSVIRASIVSLLTAVLVAAWAVPSDAVEASATQIKAAYLYKFGFFVNWPQSAFASGDSPINLCIVGNDPLGSMLDDAVKGQKIGNRPVAVLRFDKITKDSGCHIAFLPDGSQQSAARQLAALRGADVLTVTDKDSDDDGVGIINFVIDDNRVRFDIDDAAAAANGLVISSRLLNLALKVKPRP